MKKNLCLIFVISFLTLFLNIITFDSYSLFTKEKNISGTISVPGNNYCLNNDFDKLSDCMLIMENYSSSVNAAKTYIEDKGKADTTSIAPTITHKESQETISNDNGILSTTYHYSLGNSYTFDPETGYFHIDNYVNDHLADKYINYYTCGGTNSSFSSCTVLYQIKDYKIVEDSVNTTYIVTKAVKHKFSSVNSFDSQVGLYAAPDADGTSYFYRGNVQNNYVSYGGFIWKIIRRNGNGTIRMIYSGTTTSATGSKAQIGISKYNEERNDTTFVGYKYSKNFELKTSSAVTFNNIADNTSYYYGTGYSFDENTKQFKITGNTISGKWKDVHETVIKSYPYTCLKSSASDSCVFILKFTKYQDTYKATANYITYSSKDYNSILGNTYDSSAKKSVDGWYEENILNKKDSSGMLLSSYLSDEVFCNDRSVSGGSGYLFAPGSYFGGYQRAYNTKEATYLCSQSQDMFKVSNGNLKYPIAIITVDEVMNAGSVLRVVNNDFFLHSGSTYWTMTPGYFASNYGFALVWYVHANGYVEPNKNGIATELGIRPVVNLKSDIKIVSGNGSKDNPYVVSLS